MHGGSIRFALSTAGVNAWLSSDAAWPWPEKPPWVSRSVVRLLKALPEAAGRRDRRGTVLTLPVFLLQGGTDCQPAEERHIETPTPHLPAHHSRGDQRNPGDVAPHRLGNAPGIRQSPLAGAAPRRTVEAAAGAWAGFSASGSPAKEC